jgi:hypothetical protein
MNQFVKVVDNLDLKVKNITCQTGSQQRNSLALLDKIAHKLSGGKADDYIIKYCLMPKHSAILEKLLKATLRPIIQAAGKARAATTDRDMPVIASLFTPHFSRNALDRMGLKLSNDAFAAGNRHAKKFGAGFPVPPIAQRNVSPAEKETKEKLKAVCIEHSHFAANRTKKDENKKLQNVRILDMSKREVHRIFQQKHPTTPMPQSSFYKHINSFKIFKTPRKAGTDMCIDCLKGKHYQSELTKQLNRHGQQCPYALALKPFTILDHKLTNITLPSTPNCTCSIPFDHKEYIESYIIPFLEHRGLNNEQRHIYETQRKTVKAGEAVIVLDYKANIYVNRGPLEGSHEYFNQSQRSVLGMRIDWGDNEGNSHIEYVDYISTCLNHDALFAGDCLIDLVHSKLLVKGIKKITFWVDMAGHFIGREMTHTMLIDIYERFKVETKVNHFIEHHGKSPVDAHFSHLSTWIKEMESRKCIMTTRQLITELRLSVASHAKGARPKAPPTSITPAITIVAPKRKRARRHHSQPAAAPADDIEKVSNVSFVEYRPACKCHNNSRSSFFESWDDDVDVMNDPESRLDHSPHSLPSSQPERNEVTTVVPSSTNNSSSLQSTYCHDNHLAVPLNNTSSLSIQTTRRQSCVTPPRLRYKLEIPNYRCYYSFSASPPADGQPVVVQAKVLDNHLYPSHTVKYKITSETVQKPLKFAPKLPDASVIKPNYRYIQRMNLRKQLQTLQQQTQLETTVSALLSEGLSIASQMVQECVGMDISDAEETSGSNIVLDNDNDVVMRC